jgi:AmiR/NasT family two-component response regulator
VNSRIIVEQAKGVLAAHSQVDAYATIGPDEAFVLLRGHARAHGRRLSELARSIVDRSLDPGVLVGVDPQPS